MMVMLFEDFKVRDLEGREAITSSLRRLRDCED